MITQNDCIGCQACVDICPVNAIEFNYDIWGEGKASADPNRCINCGLCDRSCPSHCIEFNPASSFANAVISKENRDKGSSGGFFYELATMFIMNGGVVFGAAFDDKLKLVHRKAESVEELTDMCKSKYLHSDMNGIYHEIGVLLASNNKVMFVGTPCQVSAVKNLYKKKYADSLLLVDFLCRGTGTQKVFEICIRAEEKKIGFKIKKFIFRSKSRKAEHSFTYFYNRNGNEKRIDGYSFEFPYYYSFLKYTVFNDVCYSCKYACETRVGDITLGDFWKIQKYNKKLRDDKGVSMISVNSSIGQMFYDMVRKNCISYEYPLEFASMNNEAFRKCVEFPEQKNFFKRILTDEGEARLVDEMSCHSIKKSLIYSRTPKFVLKIYNLIRGR